MIQGHQSRLTPLEYCGRHRLSLSDSDAWDSSAQSLKSEHEATPLLSNKYQASPLVSEIEIPVYQRSIQWEVQTLKDCIESASPLIGVAVTGSLTLAPQKLVLLDGLQRFSAFTALFTHLDSLLFVPAAHGAPNPWGTHPSLTPAILALQSACLSFVGGRDVIACNDTLLATHRRTMLAGSYRAFRDALRPELDRLSLTAHPGFSLAESSEFIQALARFVQRPIFLNGYTNFQSFSDLVAAFIGINTIRVELSTADVCRSHLVTLAYSGGATSAQLDSCESKFDDTILRTDGRIKPRWAPLIKAIEYDWLGTQPSGLVPSLSATPRVGANIESELTELCDWLDNYRSFSDAYSQFIADIGDNPYVATALYSFHHRRASSTLASGNTLSAGALHLIAVAYLRRLLDGSVGDTLYITKRVASTRISKLRQLLDLINPASAGSITAPVPRAWLVNSLDRCRSEATAKIVFAACLLPKIRPAGSRGVGGTFYRMNFYKGQNNWTLDHVVPANVFNAIPPPQGAAYKDSLRNLLPILGSDNSAYQRTDPKIKLSDPSYYGTYCGSPNDPRKRFGGTGHPYIDAVVAKQASYPALVVNDPSSLVNASPQVGGCVGQERLYILADILLDRL